MITVDADAPAWAHDLARRVETEVRDYVHQPAFVPVYTVSNMPDVEKFRHRWVYVSDESGGAVPAFSDGTEWRRCTDRAVVS